MANPQKGEVGFAALGQDWTLKLGANAMCEIEDATGKTFTAIGLDLGAPEKASIKLLRAVFWGALREHHEDITVRQAGAIIDALGMQEAGRLVGEAFRAAMPEGGETRPRTVTAA